LEAQEPKKKKGGRIKGTPNRITTTMKNLVMETLHALQEDGDYNMVEWARKNPTEFYKIAAKLIPTEVTATVQNVTVSFKE
jgi:hypothetical protein